MLMEKKEGKKNEEEEKTNWIQKIMSKEEKTDSTGCSLTKEELEQTNFSLVANHQVTDKMDHYDFWNAKQTQSSGNRQIK